ncbi:toxic anion resistance protein [Magnetococcales bacterium HHB-1]
MNQQRSPIDLNLDQPTKPTPPTQSPSEEATEIDQKLAQKAQQFADALVAMDMQDQKAQSDYKDAITGLGLQMQQEAARRSQMLQQPIKTLSKNGEDGGPVANALVELKVEVEALDPQQFDLSPGWKSRMLGFIPGVGTPLKRYFSKFETAQTTIDAIVNSLKKGREQLSRDNTTLGEDQQGMKQLSEQLQHQIQLAELLDQKLQYKLDREFSPDDPRHNFIQEELLFPLRQRIMDMQQQLAVNQQGILAIEVIIRNNSELARGVNRALNVTVSALNVAVTVALALANQKLVLDKIGVLNTTTSNLISGTARSLQQQGAAIQNQASQTTIDMDALKSAFQDIHVALNDISTFRREALPKMAENILEFNQLTKESQRTIEQLERGNQSRNQLLKADYSE